MRKLYISGVEVAIDPGWSYNDKINSNKDMSFEVIDLLELQSMDIGDSVELYNNGDKIYGGIIKNYTAHETEPGTLNYSISTSDNSALANKRLIAASVENKLAGDIVTEDILPILAEEGVTAGAIEDAVIIVKATFNRITAAEALNQLQDLTGYNWWIDKNKQLQFRNPESVVAPFVLDDTTQHTGFTLEKNMDDYRNIQYVRGGKGKTSTITSESPTPKPDGVSRQFVLRFPVAEQPTIIINGVAVPDTDVGVNGLDKNKKYYFSYDSNIITQDSSVAVLTDTSTISITYKGLYDLLGISESTDEINERKLKEEGTSGKYESLTIEQSIDDGDQVVQYAQGMLAKYAKIANKISFNTEESGLEAGQLLTVNKPLYGINETYLIESVSASAADSDCIEYSVSAISGQSLGGWETFFKKIIETGKKYVIGENEVLILANSREEIENLSSITDISTYNMILCNDTTICKDTLIMSPLASEVTVND